VEQNVRQGLAYADRSAVMVAGELVATGTGAELLADRMITRLFLGE